MTDSGNPKGEPQGRTNAGSQTNAGRQANGVADETANGLERDAEDDATIDEPETADDIAAGEKQATAPVTGSLTTLIEELAAADPDVQRRLAAQGTEFVIGGTVFAGLQGDGASFRLRPEIAAAARSTPGVRPSSLGAAWVAFHPTRWDRFALDRAVAWWQFARKLAGSRG